MANPKHIKLVLAGNKTLSKWRKSHPRETLDLRRADFIHANLGAIPFGKANCEWADFRWTDLQGANFSDCNLERADFHKADMRGATLENAICLHANFEDANLRDSRFKNAIFGATRLYNTDLTNAKGLEKTKHEMPSYLDHETIRQSPSLPDQFLKGCGVDPQSNITESGIASILAQALEENSPALIVESFNREKLVDTALGKIDPLAETVIITTKKAGGLPNVKRKSRKTVLKGLRPSDFDLFIDELDCKVQVFARKGSKPRKLNKIGQGVRVLLWLALTKPGKGISFEEIAMRTFIHGQLIYSGNLSDRQKIHTYRSRLKKFVDDDLSGRMFGEGQKGLYPVSRRGWSYLWLREEVDAEKSELLFDRKLPSET